MDYDWNIENIRNFYLDDRIVDNIRWKNIFETVGIELFECLSGKQIRPLQSIDKSGAEKY